MVARTEAYVDTSAIVSFVDKSDTYHSLFYRLFSEPPALVTTPLVIAEAHAWFLRRYDRSKALKFLALLGGLKSMKIVSVGTNHIQTATEVLRKFPDQSLTLTDAMGLSLMRERKNPICWSTDFHLGLTGIPLAIHYS